MKRLSWTFGLMALLVGMVLTACAPSAGDVERNVTPTIISAKVQDGGDTLVIQGRYFGDGAGGERSYVLLGANVAGNGGVRGEVVSWTAERVVVRVPDNVGYGFAYVVVAGVRSSGIPVNLP